MFIYQGGGGEGTYCRTRNSVRGVCAVQVEQDTGVGRGVRAGEGDTGRVRASTTGDTELIARDVELGTTKAAYISRRRQLDVLMDMGEKREDLPATWSAMTSARRR